MAVTVTLGVSVGTAFGAPPAAFPKRKATTVQRKKPVYKRPVVSGPDREDSSRWIRECMEPQHETFDNVRALVPFFEHLYQSSVQQKPVHVLHFGDSHTASDDWTNTMREIFQARFGNGGPGYSFAGRPFRGYRRYDVASDSSDSWTTEGIVTRRGDSLQGLGGISLTSSRRGEVATFSASSDRAELLFLQQPSGGSMEVWIDDNLFGTVSTAGPLRPATVPLSDTPGAHRYLLRTIDGDPVRIFGTVAENGQGVTWESMGINGAQASMMIAWDPKIQATHLTKRSPALVVLAYGTNEANGQFDRYEYEAVLKRVIGRIRSAAPAASILLVGPPDCRLRSDRNLAAVIESQIRVALATGSAFWHWRDHMGGEGAMRYWVAAGLAQGDHIHFTQSGYQLIGRTLAQELLLQYERFLAARAEVEPVTQAPATDQAKQR